MKTDYEYVYFRINFPLKDKPNWKCYNKADNAHMGTFIYFSDYDEYLYFPKNETNYSLSHLTNITEFMYRLNYE